MVRAWSEREARNESTKVEALARSPKKPPRSLQDHLTICHETGTCLEAFLFSQWGRGPRHAPVLPNSGEVCGGLTLILSKLENTCAQMRIRREPLRKPSVTLAGTLVGFPQILDQL